MTAGLGISQPQAKTSQLQAKISQSETRMHSELINSGGWNHNIIHNPYIYPRILLLLHVFILVELRHLSLICPSIHLSIHLPTVNQHITSSSVKGMTPRSYLAINVFREANPVAVQNERCFYKYHSFSSPRDCSDNALQNNMILPREIYYSVVLLRFTSL